MLPIDPQQIPSAEALEAPIKRLGIGSYRRHIFLCAGPKCCKPENGEAVWLYLKQKLQTLGLEAAHVYRTRAHCLRLCQQGPIALVYPEGTWYRLVDTDAVDRIIHEHLLNGQIVEKHRIAENPLHAK